MAQDWTARSAGMLEASPDAIVGVDTEGHIVLVNTQTERLFGYARDELLGKPVEILVPDAGRLAHPHHRKAYLADPQARPMGAGMELAGRRRDGTEFPAEIALSAFQIGGDTSGGDSGGGDTLVVAAVRDMTAWKRAAAAQSQLAAIVRSSHDAIIGMTTRGEITSWNPGAERLYGYAAEDVLGRDAQLLVPPDQVTEEHAVLRHIADGERVQPYTTERVRRDGTRVLVSLTISPITDALGGIIGVASVSRDVSDRQRAEAKFHALLEAAPDAIVGVGADGRIVLVNAQTERLFGYPREELVGQRVELLIPEDRREVHPQHRNRYFADPKPRPMGAGSQLAARRKDGTEFPAEISLSALDTEEGLLVSASIRDVTDRLEAQAERERLKAQAERERVQSQLHQSQRLESLGQLAGGVAHDFNNLLGVILNCAAFLSEEVAAATWPDAETADSPTKDSATKDVQQIQRAAERAARLTHQLLAFARREVIRPQVVDLNEVVTEVHELLRRTLGEHVQLYMDLRDGLWPVLADRGQLEQVLVNLALNARDAMPRGGALLIDTRNLVADAELARAWAGAEECRRYVRLRVYDTGTGMSPETLERAFEPFYTTKPKDQGTGLGLATVYGIITQAGGTLRIESELGRGTTVLALLPATDEPLSQPNAAEEQAGVQPPTGQTILLVEDEPDLREITRRMLCRHGFEVIAVPDGTEALRTVQEGGHIDLLLTDVVMPHMLGKEVAQRVTALRPQTPVLFMSGYAQPVLASQGTLDPGVALVEKPFTEPQLLRMVYEALRAD
ncbi:MAG TPA: PAS domain S-box protein [Rugosimonospora sp.]|nr:PAS domain S-box protein [Rugosimonospora sp.]